MNKVAEIIEDVKNLAEDEKSDFLERLTEIDFDDAWDRQIERDVAEGKLENLWQKAHEDIVAGRTKSLDEFLNDA